MNSNQENKRVKANIVYFLLNPGSNWAMAMEADIVIKYLDCVLSIAVPTTHEPLEEVEIAGFI